MRDWTEDDIEEEEEEPLCREPCTKRCHDQSADLLASGASGGSGTKKTITLDDLLGDLSLTVKEGHVSSVVQSPLSPRFSRYHRGCFQDCVLP